MEFSINKHRFIKPDSGDTLFETTWDYKGYNDNNHLMPMSQRDWNETIQTQINVSYRELNENGYQGSNKIIVSSEVYMVIENLIFFTTNEDGEGLLGLFDDYKIFIDRTIEHNHLYIGNEEYPKISRITIENLLS
jgi:hypothetical protein